MRETFGRFTRLKESSYGFTLIEIMIVIAVVGIFATVTIPKYQGLTDHYHLESSAQIVAGQLRNAKQYAMDRRTKVYVMFNSTSVQVFYVDFDTDKYTPLEGPKAFDSGITFVQDDIQVIGIENIPLTVRDNDGIYHTITYIPPNFNKCVIFNRLGFLSGPVNLVLTSARTGKRVSVIQTLDSLKIRINWQ